MNLHPKKQINTQTWIKIAWIGFALTLIPLLVLAFFSHPQIDDYTFGQVTHQIAQSGGSLWEILQQAAKQVGQVYNQWQGSFAAVFLFALQPAIFGESWYFITAFLMIGAFVGASLYFGRTLQKVLGLNKTFCTLSLLVILTFSMQTIPSGAQGFFWFNGSVYYTFFYSLGLVLVAWMVRERQRPTVWRKIAILLMCVLVGGGNYITALTCLLLFGMYWLFKFLRKENRMWFVFACVLVLGASLAVSVFAPGNAVRTQIYAQYQPGIKGTVYESFYYALHYMGQWVDIAFIGVSVLLCVLFWRMAGKGNFAYRYPMLVSAAAFCLYSAQFAPAVFGMGGPGEDRLINIIYLAFWWLWSIQLYYWCGWVKTRLRAFCQQNKMDWQGAAPKASAMFRRSFPLLLLVVAVCCATRLSVSGEPRIKENVPSYLSASAVYSLVTGQAGDYHAEYQQRLSMLKDETLQVVEFTPYSDPVELLYYGDLTQDPDYPWSNRAIANYYGKERVTTNWGA